MHGLYAIVDVETLQARGVDAVAFARAVLRARPAALQLRAKASPVREILGLLRDLQPLCRQVGVPLVANDRAELAALASCDMVHVGQKDDAIARVRRQFPGLAVGLSTHSLDQLDAALDQRPAYVAYGPVFSTHTKLSAGPAVGVTELAMAHAKSAAAGIPLVAIGGITRARAVELLGAAEAIAAISDLVPARHGPRADPVEWFRNVTERARTLHELFATGKRPATRRAS
jgi:thiamine-phosphate pyrophosphorylase